MINSTFPPGLLLKEPDEEVDEDVCEAVFLQAMVCSLGAAIVGESKPLFDAYLKELSTWAIIPDTNDVRATLHSIPNAFPTLYDYYLDIDKREWVAWDWLIPEYIHDKTINFADILVPTVDTVRTTWLLDLMHQVKRPLILIGEPGTSKSAIINNYLRTLLKTGQTLVLFINMSSRTSSLDVQRNIDSIVEKRTKDVYGPPMGKRLLLFIDDMNMPQVDEYGTQQPIALLKLLFERGGMYNRGGDLAWKNLKDMGFFAGES